MYQALVARFRVGYVSNLGNKIPTAPGLVSWVQEALRVAPSIESSVFGRTPGFFGPSEGHRFWYRYFARGQLKAEEPLHPRKVKSLRREAFAIGRGRPVVFKNTYNSYRVRCLSSAFPGAVFLIVRRTPVDVARSLLRARLANGSIDSWFSLPVPGMENVKYLTPGAQVVDQVMEAYRYLDEAAQVDPSGQWFDLSYEQLCDDPLQTLTTLAASLKGSGARPVLDDLSRDLDFVRSEPSRPLSAELEDQISARLDMWAQGRPAK